MAKNKQVDESQIKAALSAIKDRKRPDIVQASQRAQILSLRRKLGKRLQPVFAEAGLDIEKINKILAQHQSDLRNVFEKQKTKSARIFSALNKNFRLGLENRRKALEHVASKPFLTTPIPLLEASQIWATPAGMLVDSHTEPMNNWAKVAIDESNDTGDSYSSMYVNFYFLWENQSDYLAVIDADCDLGAQGIVQASAMPGFFSGGSSDIQLNATFTPFVGGLEIYQSPTLIDMISASGGLDISLAIGDLNGNFETHNIDGTYHLSSSNLEVPSGQTVLFEVALIAYYYIDNGSVVLDFSYQDYSVKCPGVNIELLTAPTMVTGLHSVSSLAF